MQRITRQQGSSLLLIIGVVAALAILFASLVVLTSNVLSNTSRERTRTKAFNVAEAGLDAGLYTLGHNWPGKATTFTPTVDPAAFRAQFSTAEFPGPLSGPFIDVRFYDNYDTNGDGKIDLNDAPRDVGPGAKGDKLVFVDAQARVGKQVVRIRARSPSDRR
jgi:hypothetical protein